ncbi:hypothetical protein G5V59_02875 [Nocardioides sp. W3-2-3]|uniref:hypothetical protein n=1 Tax=Nocardioides convexus TaxID=2712224 RepID=UPI003100C7C5|nr:hypothetical protein [Nocardioides convexus]
MSGQHSAKRAKRGSGTVLAVAGAAAAVVLVLGTSGTLASWTSAVLGNDTDTVATAKAVVLAETDGTSTCRSSDQVSNVATCSTINKYGGTASPLMPGGSRTIDVTFTNLGAANGATFALAPGTCSQSPTAGSGTPAATNLCTAPSEPDGGRGLLARRVVRHRVGVERPGLRRRRAADDDQDAHRHRQRA